MESENLVVLNIQDKYMNFNCTQVSSINFKLIENIPPRTNYRSLILLCIDDVSLVNNNIESSMVNEWTHSSKKMSYGQTLES